MIFLNAKIVKKNSFSQREILNNIFEKYIFWNGIVKMNLIIQQTCAEAAKVRYTTIFEQNRSQNTCNNALLGKTPCFILKNMLKKFHYARPFENSIIFFIKKKVENKYLE